MNLRRAIPANVIMHDPHESRYQPRTGSLRFRYTIGSLLLATFCFAVLIATTHQLGRSGVAMALFIYYLVLPSLFVSFVEVSLCDLENSVASQKVFGFFVVSFVLMFFACGVGHIRCVLGAYFSVASPIVRDRSAPSSKDRQRTRQPTTAPKASLNCSLCQKRH